jgi:peptidoglycan hydrolase CwlO-like protein
MNTITSKLDAEHKEWLNKIRSWESELGEMESENGNIVARTESKDDQKKVEHFQNQILIQKERLDQMKHNIKLYGGDLDKGTAELKEFGTYYDTFKSEFAEFTSSQN